ncbi:MAG TPA: DUF1232 domain-containing protein [Vicinamibacterales bacterium]|nr:DUF1232 domain-containing protein [Vicinamibacterales bacterium]
MKKPHLISGMACYDGNVAAGSRSLLSWPGVFRALLSQARLSWRLVREPRVPLWAKAVPFAAIGYVLSPIDVLPDVVPLLGQIDDAAIILMALQLFHRLCPLPALEFHRARLRAGRPFTPMTATDDFIDV